MACAGNHSLWRPQHPELERLPEAATRERPVFSVDIRALEDFVQFVAPSCASTNSKASSKSFSSRCLAIVETGGQRIPATADARAAHDVGVLAVQGEAVDDVSMGRNASSLSSRFSTSSLKLACSERMLAISPAIGCIFSVSKAPNIENMVSKSPFVGGGRRRRCGSPCR